jgi:ribonuclease R
MRIHERILQLIAADGDRCLRRQQLTERCEHPGLEPAELLQCVDELLASGALIETKTQALRIAEQKGQRLGQILFRTNGSARLAPVIKGVDHHEVQLVITKHDTGTALHGDYVITRRLKAARHPQKAKKALRYSEAASVKHRVIQVVHHSYTQVIGTLQKFDHEWTMLPDDPRFTQLFSIVETEDAAFDYAAGEKVICQRLQWTCSSSMPPARIVKCLGKSLSPDAELRAILSKYELNDVFPKAVLQQLEAIPVEVSTADCNGRKDCREDFTFTIDPDDAKDFDDALSIEALPEGHLKVGIHIADVAAYVPANSPLDIEAQKRGNSTYLVGSVIPMLPHPLSNGLCSLIEGADRLTKSCFITFDSESDIIEVSFDNTVIHSNKRLTYRQALAFLNESDLSKIKTTPMPEAHQTGSMGCPLDSLADATLKKLQTAIIQLNELAIKLRAKRFAMGSLDLEMSEVKIYLDKTGRADRLEKQAHDASHQLIEEFMLCANEQVAKHMKKKRIPCIYRVHDEPEEIRLNELRETMQQSGLKCGNLARPREMAQLLTKLKNHPQGAFLKVHVLRSLKQAQYRARSDGHYGLAKRDYTHFTSPIRRYSDLIVHRILERSIFKGQQALDKNAYPQNKLDSMSEHLCLTERTSVDAERESIKTKLLEYFERELAENNPPKHSAMITDVKRHGLFIELCESQAFGFLPTSGLPKDHYYVSRDGRALKGRHQRSNYPIGKKIEVSVAKVDRIKRQIDFKIAEGDSSKNTIAHSARDLARVRKARRFKLKKDHRKK